MEERNGTETKDGKVKQKTKIFGKATGLVILGCGAAIGIFLMGHRSGSEITHHRLVIGLQRADAIDPEIGVRLKDACVKLKESK